MKSERFDVYFEKRGRSQEGVDLGMREVRGFYTLYQLWNNAS